MTVYKGGETMNKDTQTVGKSYKKITRRLQAHLCAEAVEFQRIQNKVYGDNTILNVN